MLLLKNGGDAYFRGWWICWSEVIVIVFGDIPITTIGPMFLVVFQHEAINLTLWFAGTIKYNIFYKIMGQTESFIVCINQF